MTKARSKEVLIVDSDLDPQCSGQAAAKFSPAPLKAVGSNPARVAFATFSTTLRGILP